MVRASGGFESNGFQMLPATAGWLSFKRRLNREARCIPTGGRATLRSKRRATSIRYGGERQEGIRFGTAAPDSLGRVVVEAMDSGYAPRRGQPGAPGVLS